MDFIVSRGTRSAGLPFSDAVRVGDILCLSGQIGHRPGTLKLVAGGIGAETRQMMDKLLTEGVTPRRMEIGDGGLFGSLETDVMSMGSELMLGSQGERVMEWQRNLNAIGEVGLKIDGVFGERTDQATRLFQSQNDLEGDGVVGPETLRRMAELKRREVTQASSGDFDVAN